ncbi:MAG: HPr family phosphocarrier protein [Clostridiaceae bacterium]
MVSREIVVNNPTGLHARPATLLVKRASSYKSDVSIEYKERKANAKSLIGVLSLGVVMGSKITLTTVGEDEEKAAEELSKLILGLDE